MIALSAQRLDPEALARAIATPAHGAVVTFLGTTRETSPGDPRPVNLGRPRRADVSRIQP